jgi:hypothetical protein
VPAIRVRAGEVRLRRPRFGIFRIGFARTLEVRDTTVELLRGASATPDPGDGGSRGRLPIAVTSVRGERVRLRFSDRGNHRLDIRAAQANVDLQTGRIELRRQVRIHGEGLDLRLNDLVYDCRARRFRTADEAALARIQAAVADLELPDLATLRRDLGSIASGLEGRVADGDAPRPARASAS